MNVDTNHTDQESGDLHTSRLQVLLVAGGLVLLLLGKYLSSITGVVLIGGIINLIGIMAIFFGFAITSENRLGSAVFRILGRAAHWLGVARWQIVLIGFGLALSLISRAAAGNDRMAHSPWHGVIWILGVVLVVIGCWRRDTSDEYEGFGRHDLLVMALFFTTAIAFRFANLENLPYSLTGDEGESGLYGLQFVDGFRNNLIDMGWNQFPALYFWLVSLSQRILGPTITAIRIVSVIAGSLSVLAVFWASKQLFNRTVAFFTGAFLAGMHFHILFSRVAVNNIWDGIFLSFMLGGVWVAWKYNLRWSFILVGLVVGFSQFFYTTGHLVPLYTAIFFLLLFFFDKRNREGRITGIFAVVLVTLAIILPLGLYYADNTSELTIPMQRVSLLSPEIMANYTSKTGNNALFMFAEQFGLTTLGLVSEPMMGLYRPQTPMLLPLSAILFITGLIISLVRIRDPRYLILILGMLGPIVAGAMSIEAPNSQRLLFATPLVAMMVGIALTNLLTILQNAWPRYRSYMSLIPITLLAIILARSLTFFFYDVQQENRFSDLGGLVARRIADYLEEKPLGSEVYIVGPGVINFNSIPSLPYLASHVDGDNIYWPLEDGKELPQASEDVILIFPPFTEEIYPEIRDHYPEAEIEMFYDKSKGVLFRALTFED